MRIVGGARRNPKGAAVFAVSVGCAALASCGGASTGGTEQAASTSTAPDVAASVTPVNPSPYPPKTYADLVELAGQADGSPKVLASDDISAVGCQKLRVSVLIPAPTSPEQTVDQLMSAYLDSEAGGGVVFAYGTVAEFHAGNGYTTGRLIHNDPCQGDDTIEVDVGNALASGPTFTVPALQP